MRLVTQKLVSSRRVTHSLTRSSRYSLTHSLTHSLTRSLITDLFTTYFLLVTTHCKMVCYLSNYRQANREQYKLS